MNVRYLNQKKLAEIANCRGPEGVHLETEATLHIERYSWRQGLPKVAIRLRGNKVGYMPPLVARAYLREISTWGSTMQIISCGALIQGGWPHGDGRSDFVLSLDLPLRTNVHIPQYGRITHWREQAHA